MIRESVDQFGVVTDVETTGRAAMDTYVATKDDPVANGAAAIRAVAEAAVLNPTWYSAWSGQINVPVTDSYGNKFSVTMPGLTAVTGYLVMVGPQALSVFAKWDKDYNWSPSVEGDWPSNVLRFRACYNEYGPVPAMLLAVSVLAWGKR